MIKKSLLCCILIICLNLNVKAWVYPEHREMALIAIQRLDSVHRTLLDKLWALARTGYEARLTEPVIDLIQGEHPTRLDYAAWPAIGGDHSTSGANMLYNVLETEWIMKVADVAARLQKGLAEADNKSELNNRLRASDIGLLRADPEYVSRAGANYGHFMMVRPEEKTSAQEYFDLCYKQGTALNLIGIYKWYHASAMMKATRLKTENLTAEQRSALALAALADEAFALHFLMDGFASGHVAGIWGDASQRKGTHDYYNEAGLEVTTWQGERVVITGDAYMRPVDAERAAVAVRISLEQVLDAAAGKYAETLTIDVPGVFTADTFNTSMAVSMPERKLDTAFTALFYPVISSTPAPGLGTGLGELPRFRSEIGPFVGIASSARGSVISSGFGSSQNTSGFVPGLGLAIRVGLGMDGVLNESGDGLAFLDLGWRLDGASSMKYYNDPSLKYFGSILSAIPSRDGYFARLRLPFFLIPGDLLIAGPILLIFAPETLNKMIVTAGNGGLIPWQSGMVTPIGRFQFVLGREVGACFYGTDRGGDALLLPENPDATDETMLISMYSVQFDFPILEYRPFRTFSARQTADVILQLNAGIDVPFSTKVIVPEGGTKPDLKTTWFIGLRLAFDWRYYFSKEKKPKRIDM